MIVWWEWVEAYGEWPLNRILSDHWTSWFKFLLYLWYVVCYVAIGACDSSSTHHKLGI